MVLNTVLMELMSYIVSIGHVQKHIGNVMINLDVYFMNMFVMGSPTAKIIQMNHGMFVAA